MVGRGVSELFCGTELAEKATSTLHNPQKQNQVRQSQSSDDDVQPKLFRPVLAVEFLQFSLGLVGSMPHLPNIVVCLRKLMTLLCHSGEHSIGRPLGLILGFHRVRQDLSLLVSIGPWWLIGPLLIRLKPIVEATVAWVGGRHGLTILTIG